MSTLKFFSTKNSQKENLLQLCTADTCLCSKCDKIRPEMRNFVTIFFVKCALFALIRAQLNEPCKVARSGSNGICRYYEDCPVVLTEIIQDGLTPTICGIQNRKEVICCPLPPTRKPTRPPLQSDRISAKSKQNSRLLLIWLFIYAYNSRRRRRRRFLFKLLFLLVFSYF